MSVVPSVEWRYSARDPGGADDDAGSGFQRPVDWRRAALSQGHGARWGSVCIYCSLRIIMLLRCVDSYLSAPGRCCCLRVAGDLLLTVYVMHERRKGKDSFYFPYLNILPDLNNLSEWKDEELSLLQVLSSLAATAAVEVASQTVHCMQDEKLIARAGSTRRLLKVSSVRYSLD